MHILLESVLWTIMQFKVEKVYVTAKNLQRIRLISLVEISCPGVCWCAVFKLQSACCDRYAVTSPSF